MLDRLAAAATKVLATEAAAVLVLEENRLKVAAACGIDKDLVTPLAEPTALESLPLVVSQNAADSRVASLPPGFLSAACVSMRRTCGPLCLIQAYGSSVDQFDPLDTERLQALADLAAAAVDAVDRVEELEHIEASKSRFIRVATHELRSPVAVAQSLVRTVLKGYAGPVDELQRDIFNRIGGRLDFLESLVNDLLDLAAGKAPELEEEEGPVVLNTSVGRTMLLLDPRAEEKGITLTFHPCKEELPVWGTDGGLDRIFVNLIGNAIKYTPPLGNVTVSVSCGGGTGRVEVADTGIGIPEESLVHLFEEFFRAPNARDLEVGTGLGLAIVKDLVDRYRGTIDVTSEVGKGTRFIVSFPIYLPVD